MTSKKRIRANRRNARKSTGPKTPEGKAAVRLNSLWHGAFATDLLLPDEDPTIFAGHRDEFLTLYQPCSQAEEFLVNRMILASWRLMRLAAMESRVLRAQRLRSSGDIDLLRCAKSLMRAADEQAEPEPEPESVETDDPIALAWIRDANSSNAMAKLARYQTALERSFYRALDHLEALRARKPE